MRRNISRIAITFIIFSVFNPNTIAQDDILQELESIAIIEQKIMVPMRDGVRLATDVYRPKTDKPVPIIFSRTPYNFNSWGNGELQPRSFRSALQAVKRGFAYVVQNERGRYFSDGKWDILGPPLTDGYDALTWMAEQPWSNGNVGTMGCSSTAEWQMAVASLGHPALKALVPMGFGAGVTVVAGLPIIRTSVAHGTAFDIAGKGIAGADTFIAAIKTAGKIAVKRGLIH